MTSRIGVVRLHNRRVYRETFGGGHTMGTTRMGTSRVDSVCDDQLRVHGYANLYLAGSSVFPSGGAVNPTLTIVALGAGRGAPAVAPLPQTPAALIVDHQGWIVRASDRDALRRRQARGGRGD